nr:MAG: polyprotein [Halyomorpha halys ifla-like virus 2]
MAYCAWTSICEYINTEVGDTDQASYTPLQLGAAAEVFDRVCNVFGWTILSRTTVTTSQAHSQMLTYKLNTRDTRSRRFLRCCMIDKKKFAHDCAAYSKSFTTEGDFEAAIKIDKKTLIDWTRDLRRYYVPHAQGPPVTTTGDDTDIQQDAQNTALLTDLVLEKEAQQVTQEDWILERSSTEKTYEFPEILDRWVPMSQIQVAKDTEGELAHFLLPHDLEKDSCVSNVFPFEQFAYGSYEFEVQVHCTSNPRQAGRVIVAATPDPEGLDPAYFAHWSQMVQRQHAWIDFASGSTASLVIPFEFHRSFVRNIDHGQNTAGVLGGVSCRIDIWVASQLRVGEGQDSNLSLQPFVRVRKAKFAGMGFKVDIKAQGPITDKIRSYKTIIDEADKLLQVVGETTGLDKPLDPTLNMLVTPVPRMHFACGKGVTDASVLKLSHFQTTSMPPRVKEMIKHATIQDIGSQLGFLGSFVWLSTFVPGDLLKAIVMSPCDFLNPLSSSTTFPTWYPTPVSMVSNMFQFWTGTTVLSFIFPATDQHKGKILCTIEFTRTASDDKDEKCQSYAAYHVVFDLGENRRFDVTVPYIYDTPWRRCNVVPLASHYGMTDVKEGVKYRSGLLQKINTRITLKIVNPLRYNKTVAPAVECLMFASAGKDYELLGLTQFNQLLPAGTQPNMFPDAYTANPSTRKKRSGDTRFTLKKAEHAHRNLGEILRPTVLDKALGNEEKQAYEAQLNALRNQMEEYRKEKERLESIQQPTEEECVEKACTQDMVAALAQWTSLNNRNLIGHKPSKSWMDVVDNLVNKPVDDYTEGGQTMIQDAAVGGPYYVGSEAWKKMAGLGALLPTMRWVNIVRAQGHGDRQVDPLKFGPKTTVSPVTTLVSQPENSLWTIMRTPVQIQRQKEIPAMGDKMTAYYIPLMPPQWTYIAKDEDKTKPVVFDSMVVTSPHVALTSQFRFWRGSMRYTIVAYDARAPIFITYVPHSGTRWVGSRQLSNDKDQTFSQLSLGMSGNRTEILVPQVNPTAHVEVPFLTENVWCTMNNGNVTGNWYWRDKGDDNAGHLVLSSEEKVKVDVWWSAGDDFRFASYLGSVNCGRPRAADALTDDHPRAQADFRLQEGTSRELVPSAQIDVWGVASAVSSVCTTTLSIPNIIGLRSLIGDARPLVGKTSDVLDAVASNLAQSQTVLSSLLLTTESAPKILEQVAEKIVTVFNKVTRATLTTVTVVKGLLDMYVCWQTASVTVMVTTVIRWLMDMGLIMADQLGKAIHAFKALFTIDDTPRAQAERDSGLKEFIRFVVEMLGCAMRFSKARVGAVISFMLSYLKLKDLCFTIRNVQFLFRFLEAFVEVISDIWYYFVGFSDPESKLAHIVQKKGDILLNYVSDAHFFLRPESKRLLKVSPRARLRYYGMLQVSYMLKKVILKLNSKEPAISEVGRLIDKVLKMNDEVFEDIASSPIRFEPFVVCLHGESGIGKSFLSTALVTELMEKVGWPRDVDPIYIRTPGKDFWDGYCGQPVVIFDDLHNVGEAQANVSTISDIYALKSSAVFNPNMAKLEEKNMRANPMLVILLTNVPFVQLPEMNCLEAYYRRRDLVVYVEKKEKEHSEDFGHLLFENYKEKVPTALNPNGVKSGYQMEYPSFVAFLKEKWGQYYEQEAKNVRFRWSHYLKCLQRESEEHLLQYDPYVLMSKHLAQTEMASGRSSTVIEDMDTAFAAYLANMQADSSLDLFIKTFEQELKDSHIRPQADIDDYRDIFGTGTQFVDLLVREKIIREQNTTFMGNPQEAAFVPSAKVYEKLVVGLTRICNIDLLEKIGNVCGFSVGVCSECGLRGRVIVASCDKAHDETCGYEWCGPCLMRGIPHAGTYIHQQGKMQKFYYVLKQLLATLAVGLNVSVGFACIALLSMSSAVFSVLKGLGYWNILYGFINMMMGNFWFGAKLILQGSVLHAILGVWTKNYDLSYMADFSLHVTGVWAFVVRTWQIWFGGPMQVTAQAESLMNLDHVDGSKEPDPQYRTVLRQYPPCYKRVAPIDGRSETLCHHSQAIHARELSSLRQEQGPYQWLALLDEVEGCWVLRKKVDGVEMIERLPLGVCGSLCLLHHSGVQKAILESLGPVCEHALLTYDNSHLDPTLEWKGQGQWLIRKEGNTLLVKNQPCRHPLCPLQYPAIVKDMCDLAVDSVNFQITEDQEVPMETIMENRPYQVFTYKERLRYERPYYYRVFTFLEYFRKIANACVWQFCSLKGNFYKLAKVVTGLALLVGSLVAFFKLISKLWAKKTDNTPAPFDWETVRAESSGDYKTTSSRRAKNPNRKAPTSRLKTRAQGAYENSMSIAALVMRNMLQLNVVTKTGKSVKLNGLGIHTNIVVFPKHFMSILEPLMGTQALINLVLQGDRMFPALLDEEDFVLDEANDLMFWKGPPSIPLFANIIKHFAKEEFYAGSAIAGQGFMMVPPIRQMPIPTIQGLTIHELVTQQTVQGLTGEYYEILDTVTYNFSMDGACGSPVLRTSSVNPLVGIHVAGSGDGVNGTGYGLIITQEMLQAHAVVKAQAQDVELRCIDEAVTNFDETVNVVELGGVEPKLSVIQPKQTKIVKSLIADDLNVNPCRVPVPLGPNEGVYATTSLTPLTSGCAHHSCDVADIGAIVEEEVGAILQARYEGVAPTIIQPKVLTPEQTVTGFKNIDYYDPMDLRTSPGWPYNRLRDGDKHSWITVERDDDEYPSKAVIDPEVMKVVEDKMKLRKAGVVPHTVFADVLKDERRKKEKISQVGSTRVICMSPLDFTITIRMYFLHFMAMFMANRLRLNHAVGISPDGPEWTDLVKKLQAVNPIKCWTLDYRNFGPGFSARAGRAAFKVMIEWTRNHVQCSQEEVDAMNIMSYELLQSKHICNDLIYQQTCGSPSGAALTVVINSLVNEFYLIWAVRSLLRRLHPTWNEMDLNTEAAKHVVYVTYGDDVIATTSAKYIDSINAKTISAFLQQYNIASTDSAKGEQVLAYGDYETTFSFLKRGLKPHPRMHGKWLAPIEWHVVEEAAYYSHSSGNLVENTLENAQASMLLAFGHGEEKFNDWRAKVNKCLARRGLKPLVITWQDLNHIFFPSSRVLSQAVVRFEVNHRYKYAWVQDNVLDNTEENLLQAIISPNEPPIYTEVVAQALKPRTRSKGIQTYRKFTGPN